MTDVEFADLTPVIIQSEFKGLSSEQGAEILRILLDNGVSQSKNENGVFFSWNDLEEETRKEIWKALRFGRLQREKVEAIEREIDTLESSLKLRTLEH